MKSISVIDMKLKKNLRATNVPVTEASKQEGHNFKALRSVNRAPSAPGPISVVENGGNRSMARIHSDTTGAVIIPE